MARDNDKPSPKASGCSRRFCIAENPMNAQEMLATHDYRDLMQSLGVARSATDFCCPKCSARSFMVLRACPMEVECLKCGTVAPFSIRAAHSTDADADTDVTFNASAPPPRVLSPVAAR